MAWKIFLLAWHHSKGVKSEVQDKDGRYILVDAIIQDSPFLLLKIFMLPITPQSSVLSSQAF